MGRLLSLLLVFVALLALPCARADGFVAIALHDVVDDPGGLDGDAVTSDRLVALLDWLAGNGYTAISLADLGRARRGERALPERAVLLTVDDGYLSLYTRIFPLALAYRMPVVAGLVSSWIDVPAGGTVRYGDADVPRARFITWAQAREMQASGWIEFASHSDALHQPVLANPQGNLLPAAVTRRYTAGAGYESAAAWRERVTRDLRRSRDRMASELGRAPRAVVWPYGRYSGELVEVAQALGFRFALTLDPAPASATQPLAIARYLPTLDPTLGHWVTALRFEDPWPSARRLVCVDPAAFAHADPEMVNERLGRAIERLHALGATDVVITALAHAPDGAVTGSWFPTAQLPVQADLLSRLAAQMRNRAGVRVAVRLPHRAALVRLGDPERVLQLFGDLGAHVAFDALVVEDAASFGAAGTEQGGRTGAPWEVAQRRHAQDPAGWPQPDVLALRAFRVAERYRPGLALYWLAAPGWPALQVPALADLTLLPARVGEDVLQGASLQLPAARRIGVWWEEAAPDALALAAATRRLQLAGATAMGWCPDDPLADRPRAAVVAPAWSGAGFPRTGGRP